MIKTGKDKMEHGLLFKKTSTCYSNPDIEYLDETSDYKLNIQAKRAGVEVSTLKQKNQEINQSIEYLTKESHGRVYAGGFLRDALLSKKAEAPEKWDNQIRKKAIKAAIYQNIRQFGAYRSAVGHKLIFSMNKELEEKLDKAGLNTDEIMAKEIKKIMYSFQNKFHPGEKIGFAWGIHHDTDNRHIHLYLCNRTDKGSHVAMSSPLKEKRFRKYQQQDQIGFIKQQLTLAQERIIKQVNSLNNGYLPHKVSELTRPKLPIISPDNSFREEQEKLTQMRLEMAKKQEELERQQDLIRRRFNDYCLIKAAIEAGYDKLKNMNKVQQERFLALKQSKSVINSYTLSKIGLLPKFGAVKQFADLLFKAQYSQKKELIEQLNLTKLVKEKLQKQLEILNQERQKFRADIARLKDEKKQIEQQFYRTRFYYETSLLRHNYKVFMNTVTDKQLKEQYYQVSKKFWQKRRNKEDSTAELEQIRHLDNIAKELIPRKRSLAIPKENTEDNSRKFKL